jgi:hypothetical protein
MPMEESLHLSGFTLDRCEAYLRQTRPNHVSAIRERASFAAAGVNDRGAEPQRVRSKARATEMRRALSAARALLPFVRRLAPLAYAGALAGALEHLIAQWTQSAFVHKRGRPPDAKTVFALEMLRWSTDDPSVGGPLTLDEVVAAAVVANVKMSASDRQKIREVWRKSYGSAKRALHSEQELSRRMVEALQRTILRHARASPQDLSCAREHRGSLRRGHSAHPQ